MFFSDSLIIEYLPGDNVQYLEIFTINYSKPGYFRVCGNASNMLGHVETFSNYVKIENLIHNLTIRIENSTNYQVGTNFSIISDDAATDVFLRVKIREKNNNNQISCGEYFYESFDNHQDHCSSLVRDGFYLIIAEMRNNVSSILRESEIFQIGTNVSKPSFIAIQPKVVAIGEDLTVIITVQSGINVQSQLKIGQMAQTRYLGSLLNGTQIFTFKFSPSIVGFFNASLNISNEFNFFSIDYNKSLEVQEQIIGFEAIGRYFFNFDSEKIFWWKLQKGNPVDSTLRLNGLELPIVKHNITHYFSNVTNVTKGIHRIDLLIENKVNNLTIYSTNLTVEEEIIGFHLKISNDVIKSNETNTVQIRIHRGTNVHFVIETNSSITIQKSFIAQFANNFVYTFSVIGKYEGIYALHVTSSNTLSNLKKSLSFTVYQPIVDLQIRILDITTTYKPLSLLITFLQTAAAPSESGVINLYP